jgi:hypothetical protein
VDYSSRKLNCYEVGLSEPSILTKVGSRLSAIAHWLAILYAADWPLLSDSHVHWLVAFVMASCKQVAVNGQVNC